MMYILHTTCPECGTLHAVHVLPALAQTPERDDIRQQLANAFDAISIAREHLRQEQYNAAALVLDDAMGGKR